MKILIVEDEKPAAEKLERIIKRYDSSIIIDDVCDSVSSAVKYLERNQDKTDLIFMDIQLKDGKSFEIFEKVEVTKPIIFTTAYDDYAIQAFKVNSIAYLLKPYSFDEVKESIDKLVKLKKEISATIDSEVLKKTLLQIQQKPYKTRFMVKIGDHLKTLRVEDIAYFFADGRTVYLVANDSRRFIIDFNLEELNELLDPHHFFRASRAFILSIDAVKDASSYSNSRLKVSVEPKINKDIIVSRDRVSDFKEWLSGQPV